MKLQVLNKEGKKVKEMDTKLFEEPIRIDIISKIVEAEKIRQPFSNTFRAGMDRSASGNVRHRRHVWKSHYGRGIPEDGIVGKSRRKEIVEARQTAMFLCRNILDSSLSSVGMYFGGRDHTTVIHAIKTIEEKKTKKKNIGEHIAQITQELSFF